MKKLFLFATLLLLFSGLKAQQKTIAPSEREQYISYLDKVACPVIQNLANDELKAKMPVVFSDRIDNKESRSKVLYLEAFGRTLSGIAPWLELEGGSVAEQKLRNQYREWALKAIANAVNPAAKDYMQWEGGQPLVDGSFFALGLIRSPWLWAHLSPQVQQQVIAALNITRKATPGYNNWILFSGVIEAFYCKYGLPYDQIRLEYGVREFMEHWYVGDGLFSDGQNFHLDYYNSYVIQPFLWAIIEIANSKNKAYTAYPPILERISARYTEILERAINADGSFAASGRSIVYRGGAFHHLANMALRKQLPEKISPAQVRAGLLAVIKKTLSAPETFTADGWLNIGLSGKQPGLADAYITTGSLYLCTEIFLPLGLPDTDPYWSAPPQLWTEAKIWSGQDAVLDHAMDMNDKTKQVH